MDNPLDYFGHAFVPFYDTASLTTTPIFLSAASFDSFAACLTRQESTVHVLLSLHGGVYDPSLAALAKTFNTEKMVCRK